MPRNICFVLFVPAIVNINLIKIIVYVNNKFYKVIFALVTNQNSIHEGI